MLPSGEARPRTGGGVGVLVALGGGTLASVTRFSHHDRPSRDPAEERFDGDQVIFTAGGHWRIDRRGGRVEAGPEVVVLGRDGEVYRCDHGGGVPTDRNLSLQLDPGALRAMLGPHPDRLSAALADQPLPDLLSLPLTPEARLTVRRLLAEAGGSLPGRRLRLDSLVVDLLIGLHRAAGGLPRGATGATGVTPRQRAAVEAVRRHIDAHLGDDLGLAELAALAHISPFHFSRMFRAVTGLPPHRYLRRARLERARQLLDAGDATVTTIANQVGFSSTSHFIAAFRRHTGVTPGQYRAGARALPAV